MLTNLPSKAIVNLRMAWDRGLRAIRRILVYRVPRPFPFQITAATPQMVNQLAPFHLDPVPA